MFNKKVLKSIAYVVLISYISVSSASSLSAAEWQLSVTPQLFAQASTTPAASSRTTPEEEKALRQIYDEKINRLEAEMNNARGTRNTLLTVAVTSFFIGAGILSGSSTVKSSVEDIVTDTPEEEEDKDDAIQALDAVNGVGAGVIGVGGVSLLGYLFYTATIGSKQRRIDTLRDELDARFQVRGLTPEYLQRNESVAAVVEEIELAKKSAGSSRTLQGLFSRIAIGSILSGGFLFTLATAGRDVVEDINVDENDPEEVASRDDALDQTDNIETTGIVLLGAGAACGVASFFFGRRAKSKENQIDELENSLLRVAERIDIQPKPNGFMVMYTHQF